MGSTWFDRWFGFDSVSELRRLDLDSRKAVWDQAQEGIWNFRIRLLLAILIVPTLFVLLFGVVPSIVAGINAPLPRTLASVLLGVLVLCTWSFVELSVLRRLTRRRLWRLVPYLCSACGYDLTGNTSGVCPECGRAVKRPTDAPG